MPTRRRGGRSSSRVPLGREYLVLFCRIRTDEKEQTVLNYPRGIANVFAARGYLVASIQQDLPTDPPLVTKVGLPYVGRLAVYQKGEANILFVLDALRKLKPRADYAHLTLVGHSKRRRYGDVFCSAAFRPGLESYHA